MTSRNFDPKLSPLASLVTLNQSFYLHLHTLCHKITSFANQYVFKYSDYLHMHSCQSTLKFLAGQGKFLDFKQSCKCGISFFLCKNY